MDNYIRNSLETHLFFARIMKEHALFLEAGFPCKEKAWIQRTGVFRMQFENLHRDVVAMSDGRVSREILDSCELLTEHTLPAERRTQQLSGVPIDSRITMRQQDMSAGNRGCEERNVVMAVERMNHRALQLLDAFIAYKEKLLQEITAANVYNANYPLLIKHVLREAKLYRALVCELLEKQDIPPQNLWETENFWNQIMMEHALFIRGLLDPSEAELIDNADCYAVEYRELLALAGERDAKAEKMREEALGTTLRFSGFKEAGTEGILECKIASIIMPLLADHVLREANHYIRLLKNLEECSCHREKSCGCEKCKEKKC